VRHRQAQPRCLRRPITIEDCQHPMSRANRNLAMDGTFLKVSLLSHAATTILGASEISRGRSCSCSDSPEAVGSRRRGYEHGRGAGVLCRSSHEPRQPAGRFNCRGPEVSEAIPIPPPVIGVAGQAGGSDTVAGPMKRHWREIRRYGGTVPVHSRSSRGSRSSNPPGQSPKLLPVGLRPGDRSRVRPII
jgi:hypothetical protein